MRQEKDQVCLYVWRMIKYTITGNVFIDFSYDDFVIIALERLDSPSNECQAFFLYQKSSIYLTPMSLLIVNASNCWEGCSPRCHRIALPLSHGFSSVRSTQPNIRLRGLIWTFCYTNYTDVSHSQNEWCVFVLFLSVWFFCLLRSLTLSSKLSQARMIALSRSLKIETRWIYIYAYREGDRVNFLSIIRKKEETKRNY